MNVHRLVVSGTKFPDIAAAACELFDDYFGRGEGMSWRVTRITADRASVMNGAGIAIAGSWTVEFEAEIDRLTIGTTHEAPALKLV